MPRARKRRCIYLDTNARYFKPRGVPLGTLDIIRLTFEELEAIRLKDLIGLEQTEASEKMGVSQPTFHRILKDARNKVSDALVNSKAIEISGGNYKIGINEFKCLDCDNSWVIDIISDEEILKCPKCNGTNIKNPNKVNQND